MEVTASSSIDTTEEVLKLNKEKTNEGQAEEKDKVQKRLDLPPEFDEYDSRWTVKCREPAPGLVELMEHSGVYVNADKLSECENLSSDSNRLAQLLLTEIFTKSALSTCSWSGTKADIDTDINGGHATSELDAHATNILLNFVKEYAQRHGWDLTDCHCIVKNLRQLMFEMRQKKLNSRWTLKYRKPAPGLVELMEHSRVYVSGDKLGKCLNLSNDCVTLARMLLSEIFTTSALSSCSMTDTTAEYKKQRVTNMIPVLDEHALLILVMFAVEYGREKNWTMVSNEQSCIQASICQKMEVMRRVERKTKEEAGRVKIIKKFCFLRLGILLPEYGANDSRWTLKYSEPTPGLLELIEHSGVYVNADKLAECKEVSKDCVTLAQKLLIEVFTTRALATCSLSVENSKYYEFYVLERVFRPKPELDAYAEIVLLNYVDEHGLEQGWPVLHFRCIKMGITDMMRQMEQQYALKQEEIELLALDKLTIIEDEA